MMDILIWPLFSSLFSYKKKRTRLKEEKSRAGHNEGNLDSQVPEKEEK